MNSVRRVALLVPVRRVAAGGVAYRHHGFLRCETVRAFEVVDDLALGIARREQTLDNGADVDVHISCIGSRGSGCEFFAACDMRPSAPRPAATW